MCETDYPGVFQHDQKKEGFNVYVIFIVMHLKLELLKGRSACRGITK